MIHHFNTLLEDDLKLDRFFYDIKKKKVLLIECIQIFEFRSWTASPNNSTSNRLLNYEFYSFPFIH